jgi:TRAP-type C4-dicarboxylate transport system substrate-binding protein
VAKTLLQMNALFMPFAPLVSGRIWQGLDAKDKDLIRKLVAQSLDAQINDIVTTEAGLIEKFKGTSIAFKTASTFNPDSTIQEFDKLWLPKAPQIAELRKAGASLA